MANARRPDPMERLQAVRDLLHFDRDPGYAAIVRQYVEGEIELDEAIVRYVALKFLRTQDGGQFKSLVEQVAGAGWKHSS